MDHLNDYVCTRCNKILCNKHNDYGENDLLSALDIHYQFQGIDGLSFQSLKASRLYYGLYKYGWNAEKICQRYGMTASEWKKRRKKLHIQSKGQINWSPDKVYQVWDELVEHYGYVPTANEIRKEFQKYVSIFGYMTEFRITFDEIRAKYPDKKYGPKFGQMLNSIEGHMVSGMKNRTRWTESVNGMRWHSRVEASVSNFLYARGIPHRKGELYDEKYAEDSGYARGWFDIHFESLNGDTIDLEIWGNMDEKYMQKRSAKEKFNEDNPNFLGIDWEDCFDSKLTEIFEPYIGVIEPYIFEKPEHKVIQTAFWTDADEVIETCRWIAEQQPDGRFPTEHWLRKRGEYADRDGETYNTLGIYIQKYIGGLLKLRTILGEDTSHYRRWNRESTLIALDEWIQEHGTSPQAYVTKHRRHGGLDQETYLYASSLNSAIDKHLGKFTDAMEILGYSQKNRLSKWTKGVTYQTWTRESALLALDEWMQEHGISPQAYRYRHKTHKNLDDECHEYAKLLIQVIQKLGKFDELMVVLGYSRKDRYSNWNKDVSKGPPSE